MSECENVLKFPATVRLYPHQLVTPQSTTEIVISAEFRPGDDHHPNMVLRCGNAAVSLTRSQAIALNEFLRVMLFEYAPEE